jgi:hypothetical protein
LTDARDPEASPAHSRSSSAQGSVSTSATTFEDADDATGTSKGNSKQKEAKGNVLVSVRVRPDGSGGETSRNHGEWAVDGRQSLISYRGKEGGDYYYGECTPSLNCNGDLTAGKITSSQRMRIMPRFMILRQNGLFGGSWKVIMALSLPTV